jgi:PAS domain S-box-containing protein
MGTSKAAVAGSQTPGFPPLRETSHGVHFYGNDDALMDQVASFIGSAIVNGDVAVVIAVPAHREALVRELDGRGLRVSKARAEGRYIAMDAAETLSRFMDDDAPDERRFEQVIGAILAKARAGVKEASPYVNVFGEMVAVLCSEGNHVAAIRLEELWNRLALKQAFSLRCAYPMNSFETDEHGELFLKICEQHSAVVPELGEPASLNEDDRLRTIARLQQKVQALEHQKVLRESEERFRLLVEAVQDYAIYMLDAEGHVNSWNIGAERIKGYSAPEVLGKHFSVFFPEEDVRAGKPERELEKARQEGRALDEGWRVRKDGSKFWANVVLTALRNESGKVIGFAKVTRDFTEKKEAQRLLEESQHRLQESEKSLRQLSLRLLQSQDEERRRIARDLHDSLGQYLSVLKMKLDSLANAAAGKGSGDLKELAQCAELTDEAVKEVRTISYLLYPPMLEELGLGSAMPWYVSGFAARSGIKTTFEISPGFGRLPGDIELVLFRVLQESLTNVHRHSGSATADVQLSRQDGEVVLKISDKGKGVQSGNFEQAGHDWMGAAGVGLRGMSERVRQVGGRLELSSDGEGTTVTAAIPVYPPAAD